MNEYTRENPFEFEGVKAWVDHDGALLVQQPDWNAARAIYADELPTIAAFIEAERDTWHWTNADKTEARCGRWTMRDDGHWVLHHDDFIPEAGVAPYWTDGTTGLDDRRISAIVRPVIDDFLAWHAAQQQPEEPEGFGYVGTVVSEAVPEVRGEQEGDVFRTCQGYTVVWRHTGGSGVRLSWAGVLARGTFERAVRS